MLASTSGGLRFKSCLFHSYHITGVICSIIPKVKLIVNNGCIFSIKSYVHDLIYGSMFWFQLFIMGSVTVLTRPGEELRSYLVFTFLITVSILPFSSSKIAQRIKSSCQNG